MCFYYRFYITLLGLNHSQLSRFNCKVANLIMQIGCFQILLVLGMEFLRKWVMWRNWYEYDHYYEGITSLIFVCFSISYNGYEFGINFLCLCTLGSWAILPPWDLDQWKLNWFWHNTIRWKAWYVSQSTLF